MISQKQKNDDKLAPEEKSPRRPAGISETPKEKGGPPGPEPTRYGDWERNGKCVDF